MRYDSIRIATFLRRPNRFIAHCQWQDQILEVHVANTGRCQELLIPGVEVALWDRRQVANRKTQWTLVAVKKGELWINIDSQAPNRLVWDWLKQGGVFPSGKGPYLEIQKEVSCGNSRLDFSIRDAEQRQVWIEVKGVTLERNRIAFFPDAPTERGLRHVLELTQLARDEKAIILFILQMQEMKEFRPNVETHPAFGDALREAQANGVQLLAWGCKVGPDYLELSQEGPVIPICL